MQPTNKYLIYGLKISTNQPIPALVPVQNSEIVDIDIALLGQQQNQLPLLSEANWFLHPNSIQGTGINIWQAQSDDGVYFRLQFISLDSQAIEFIINPNGRRVWAFWSLETPFSNVVALLQGSVLGRVLLLRGVLCLHASVVNLNGKAIAIVGHSGQGKSTTAAAFAQLGFPILADDIAALKQDGTKFWVQPGYACLRLWRNTLLTLGCSVEELSKVSTYAEKRYLDLSISGDKQWQFHQQPLPLSGIYLLGKREFADLKPEVIPISQSEALGELAANLYGKRILDKQRIVNNFQQLSQLVQIVPIRRLERPNDLGSLSVICDTIIKDFEHLSM